MLEAPSGTVMGPSFARPSEDVFPPNASLLLLLTMSSSTGRSATDTSIELSVIIIMLQVERERLAELGARCYLHEYKRCQETGSATTTSSLSLLCLVHTSQSFRPTHYTPSITTNDGSSDGSELGGAQERRHVRVALVCLPVHHHHVGSGQSSVVEAWIPGGREQV